MDAARIAQLRRSWREFFAGEPLFVALAPGRINLIGEHVDYNDGHVLPMAIDRHLALAAAPRSDRRVRLISLPLHACWEVPLDRASPPAVSLAPGATRASLPECVVRQLRRTGLPLIGADLLLDADLPVGAGLSSSAALELVLARALVHAAGAPWDALATARLCQQAEEDALAVRCGPMDQTAVACGVAGAALLLDCRAARERAGPDTSVSSTPASSAPSPFETVALPPRAAFVVMDTGVRRRLSSSEYNARRRSCEDAVAAIAAADAAPGGLSRVRSLRETDTARLAAACERIDTLTFRRALHVLEELPRAEQMARALRAGDLPAAGALMNDSHHSLAELYEVSSPELDLITELARSHRGCHGARLTGAGFGGCAIALVDGPQAEHFAQDVSTRYRARSGQPGELFVVAATDGAHIVAP